jgi:UDP-glucose 4-epimerase
MKKIHQRQVLITGGLGFVGHHLVRRLIEKKYFPIILDNCSNGSTTSLSGISEKEYSFTKVDVRNIKEIEKTVSDFKPSFIIHLAALHFIPYCNEHPEEVLEVNVEGTENLLEVAKKFKIRNFLFASSAAVYAISGKKHTEDGLLEPVDIYGKSKKIAEEKLVSCSTKDPDLNFTILRFFNIYGDGDNTPHFIPEMVGKISNNPKISTGNLETIRDYIYIDDVVDAILLVLEKNEEFDNQIYNLGTSIGTKGIRVVRLIADYLGKEPSIKLDEKLLRKVDQPELVAEIDKFSREYKWSPNYNIEKGLKKMMKVEES